MVKYMPIPQLVTTITHSAVAYTPEVTKAEVKRIENGFDTATVYIADTKSLNYGVRVGAGDAITLQVKDASDAAYTTIFNGIIRVCLPSLDSKSQLLVLKCDGAGFGLAECLVGQEFGVDSRNPTYDTIGEIVGAGDAGVGILHAWVNHYLGDTGAASNYVYTSDLEAMTGDIKYICFPYKPANRCIDDLCDLVTAIRQGVAYHPDHIGPHWIVDTDSMLRMKLVNGTQAGWTQYYGDSAVAATLAQGVDFLTIECQDLDPEANCVLYYGNWRRPSNGDSWTESSVANWACLATNTVSVDAANYKVGSKSVKAINDDAIDYTLSAWYPTGKAAAWDFSWCTEFSTPSINFWARRSAGATNFYMYLQSLTGAVLDGSYWTDLTASLAAANTWYHFKFPVGPYYNVAESPTFAWTVDGTPTWAGIDDVLFSCEVAQNVYINVDGLHFGGAPILRVAKNSTSITAKKLRTKIIVDDVGKDDSLLATDDTGLMAQLAYSELLRLQTTPKVGTVTTPMIKDLLPGQWLHVHALTKADGSFAVDKDMRTTELHHTISEQGFLTTIQVTDDLTNTHTRARYNDINKVQAAFRPEFQDRQAASIKAGEVDIRVLKLEHDYP